MASSDTASKYVVKSRRTFGDVEVTSVIASPMSAEMAIARLAELNAKYQNPGNFYIEKWEKS